MCLVLKNATPDASRDHGPLDPTKPSATDDPVIGRQRPAGLGMAEVANLWRLFSENGLVEAWYQLCDYAQRIFSNGLAVTCLA
jgi:hypothetical protein